MFARIVRVGKREEEKEKEKEERRKKERERGTERQMTQVHRLSCAIAGKMPVSRPSVRSFGPLFSLLHACETRGVRRRLL